MKKEIIKFYADKALHIPKMIARRPAGISPEQIEAAAVEVYQQVQDGFKVKTIRLAGHVKEVARKIDASQYIEDRKLIDEAKEIIAEKDRKFKRLATGAIVLSILAVIAIILRCL